MLMWCYVRACMHEKEIRMAKCFSLYFFLWFFFFFRHFKSVNNGSEEKEVSSTFSIIIFSHKTVIRKYSQTQSLPVLAVVRPPSPSLPLRLYLEPSSQPWRTHFLLLCGVADIICRPLSPELNIIHTHTHWHSCSGSNENSPHREFNLFLKTGSLSINDILSLSCFLWSLSALKRCATWQC